MAKRTGIYLPDDLERRFKALGVPMAEIIRLGLDAAEGRQPITDTLRDVLRVELSEVPDRDEMRALVTDATREAMREARGGQWGA
jgi:hypothetical protein